MTHTSREPAMTRHVLFAAAALIASAAVIGISPGYAQSGTGQITVLYDAFGKDAAMRKDWGFSALVEVAGKRILFDTGDDRDIFAANVKAKGVDLTNLDFVVLSHRHGDHMAGLSHVLSVNPKVKIYAPKESFGGIYGFNDSIKFLPQGWLPAAGDALLRRHASRPLETRQSLAGRQH